MERDLYCYDYVERPSGEIVQLFRTDPRRLLQLSTTEAVRHADEIAAELHVELAGLDIGTEVSIEIDAYNIHGDAGSFHLRWEAATRPALFPSMQASLEIAPLARGSRPLTQLSLAGHYRPPLGPLGVVGDVVIGHRVAEASIYRFLRDLASRIEQELPTAAPHRSS